MKKIFINIITSLLTFVIVFSSLSFKIVSRLCNDKVINVSFSSKVNACSNDKDTCCRSEIITESLSAISKSSCCKDEISFIKGIILTTKPLKKEIKVDQKFCNIPNIVTFYYTGFYKLRFNYKNYFPPNLIVNYQTALQTFLI